MITIELGNSYSKIIGLDIGQEKQLREILSFTVGGKSAYFGRGHARKKSMLSKRCEFPTGLIHRTLLWGKSLSPRHSIQIKDKRIGNFPQKFSGPVRTWPDYYKTTNSYLAQLAAVKAAHHAVFGRGIIAMPTGTGKSRVIAHLVFEFNVSTLVIVPSLEIKRQLQHDLRGFSNVTIENIDSKALRTATGFDMLIIDEAHHVAAKTYHKLNKTVWKNIYYRFFLTATPFRNDEEEQLLFEAIAGAIIYKLDYHTAIRERYIVPVEAYYIELPKQKTEAYTWQEVYKELVVHNSVRNNMIGRVLLALQNSHKSTLCLVKEVTHGKILSEYTGVPFVHGEDDESRKHIQEFNQGNLKALISTTGIMGEGVDTRPCEYVILAGLGKAKSSIMQQIGRAVRNYPGKESAKIILIKDTSHKFCSRHFKAQSEILRNEYACEPTRLDI